MGRKKGGASKRGWEDEIASRPSSKLPVLVPLPASACAAVVPPGSSTAACGALQPEVTTLLEDGEGDSMMVAASILSTAECRAWIEWGEATGFKLEKHAQTSPRVIFMHNKRPGVFKHHPPTYTTIHHHTPPYTTLYHAQRYVLMLFIWLTFAT